MKKKRIRLILCVVFVAVMLFSGYQVFEICQTYAQSDAVQREIVQVAAVAPVAETGEDKPNPDADKIGVALAAETPAPTERAPITVDFDALRNVNPDIVGWLYCEGTVINYPVVQGSDNVYYLNHLYTGEHNHCGTLFVDCNNSIGFTDSNTVIYGHHMKSGSMFASLVQYRDQEYYDAHPVIYLLTPDQNYRLDLFSGYVTVPSSEGYSFGFSSQESFRVFLDNAKNKSDFSADVEVTQQDRIITLSTCTYEYDNARYVVHARLTAIG